MAEGTRSLRVAAELADVTRAVARAVAADGLIPTGELTDTDVVVLRAAATVRTVVFAGERQPANATRTVRPRETDLAARVREVVGRWPASKDTCAVVYPDRVRICADNGELITTIIEAHRLGEQYLVLPIGAWATEIRTGAPAPAAPVVGPQLEEVAAARG